MTEPVPRLIHTGHGNTVSYKGKYLYSQRDPKKNPQKVAAAVQVYPKTLIIVPSPLLFYGIRTLLERLPHDCHILCIETDQRLMAFTLEHAPDDLLHNETISIVRTDDPAALTAYIDTLDTGRFRRASLLALSGGYRLAQSVYESFAAAAERHIQRYWQNRITLVHMSRLWTKNIIQNLARFYRWFGPFPVMSHKPIVVAGAGESLEKNLDLLRKLRERFFLVAVDTALPVLTLSGIYPDLVVVLEGQLINSGDFIGHGNRRLSIISDLSAHPSTLGSIKGEKHFVLSLFAQSAFLKRLESCGLHIPSLRPMGSVGIAAVQLARRLSNAPLFLTGLDFCYVPGKPHSRGALSHILSLTVSRRDRPVGWYGTSLQHPPIPAPGVSGENVTTNLVLYSYGLDLDELIKSETDIYDLRREGIKLQAVPLLDESDFLQVLKGWEETGAGASADRFSAQTGNAENSKLLVSNFLQKELGLLNEFIDQYRRRDSATASADRTRLIKTLNTVDYIYLDFPDAREITDPAEGFLIRAAASAADYRFYIQKALKVLA